MKRASQVDEEGARFWAHVDKVASEVASWPEWMKGDLSISAPDMEEPEQGHLTTRECGDDSGSPDRKC